MRLSRRWRWPASCPKRTEASNAPKISLWLTRLTRGTQMVFLPQSSVSPTIQSHPPCRLFVTSSQRPRAACPARPGPQDRAGTGGYTGLLQPAKEPPGTWTGKKNFFLRVGFTSIKQLDLTFKFGWGRQTESLCPHQNWHAAFFVPIQRNLHLAMLQCVSISHTCNSALVFSFLITPEPPRYPQVLFCKFRLSLRSLKKYCRISPGAQQHGNDPAALGVQHHQPEIKLNRNESHLALFLSQNIPRYQAKVHYINTINLIK